MNLKTKINRNFPIYSKLNSTIYPENKPYSYFYLELHPTQGKQLEEIMKSNSFNSNQKLIYLLSCLLTGIVAIHFKSNFHDDKQGNCIKLIMNNSQLSET